MTTDSDEYWATIRSLNSIMDGVGRNIELVASNDGSTSDRLSRMLNALQNDTIAARMESGDQLCKIACKRFGVTEDQLFMDLESMYEQSPHTSK